MVNPNSSHLVLVPKPNLQFNLKLTQQFFFFLTLATCFMCLTLTAFGLRLSGAVSHFTLKWISSMSSASSGPTFKASCFL